DSLRALLDSLRQVPDSLQEVPDSLQEVPDSLQFHELPAFPRGVPGGWERGVWVWEREDLLSTRALTLGELLSLAPGMIPIRGGDYGTPTAVTAFGLGGGRLRVFLDGFEMVPLDGGVPDLAGIDLGGLESVRLERGSSEIRVELESYRFDDPRPMSVVEAGTGDLRTNHLRGTFAHPRALRGSLGLGIERTDTRGPGGRESGSVSGGWLRYTLHRGDDAGLRFEYRTGTAESELETYPGKVTRKDWALRGRVRLADGVVAEAYTGMSEVAGGEDDGLTPIEGSRRQHGLRLGMQHGDVWVRGAYRWLGGPELPSSSLDIEAGGAARDVGGVAARWSRDVWDGRGTSLSSVTA
ncbi:MAG TPA: TonB-dependent receptor plug domain-containing protein, partial [Longimicrobiales bacterium]|nr:TonB-dependent receptor plug domain-containing protein [Longimicrobiales bacterium]